MNRRRFVSSIISLISLILAPFSFGKSKVKTIGQADLPGWFIMRETAIDPTKPVYMGVGCHYKSAPAHMALVPPSIVLLQHRSDTEDEICTYDCHYGQLSTHRPDFFQQVLKAAKLTNAHVYLEYEDDALPDLLREHNIPFTEFRHSGWRSWSAPLTINNYFREKAKSIGAERTYGFTPTHFNHNHRLQLAMELAIAGLHENA